MKSAPWRVVKDAYIRENHKQLGRLLGSVMSREWILTLECGHRAQRYVQVPDGPEIFRVRLSKLRENPPKKARCRECQFKEAVGK
jgi:hypothetical protein